MAYVYIDSGTTNTRIYLIENNQVIDSFKAALGSKDIAVEGSNAKYVSRLKDLYNRIVSGNCVSEDKIENIYASGMITSRYGLKEVRHITLPVSLDKLANSLVAIYDDRFTNRNVYLVPGVKNITQEVTSDNIFQVDTMRGEEVECFGVQSVFDNENENLMIIFPGSHTNIGYMHHGILSDCTTTLAGEIFNAIYTNSLLSGSIDTGLKEYNEELILKGYEVVAKYGISKALHFGNMMQQFNVMDKRDITSYIEGIVFGNDAFYIKKLMQESWTDVNRIIVVNNGPLGDITELLVKHSIENCPEVTRIRENCSVKGIMSIVKYRKENGIGI